MDTHAKLIRLTGRPSDLAKALNVSRSTVNSWITRDAIPPERWMAFLDYAHANRRTSITLERLAIAAAQRK